MGCLIAPQDVVGGVFGYYNTRGGLDLKQRELATLSILIALGGAEPQIKGHVQGNVNVGNGRAPRTLTALKCLDEIAPETKGDGHE